MVHQLLLSNNITLTIVGYLPSICNHAILWHPRKDSTLSTVTRLQNGSLSNHGSSLCMDKKFFSSPRNRGQPWGHPSSYNSTTPYTFMVCKRTTFVSLKLVTCFKGWQGETRHTNSWAFILLHGKHTTAAPAYIYHIVWIPSRNRSHNHVLHEQPCMALPVSIQS